MRIGYANATDRIAAALIAAVKPWQAKHVSDLQRLRALAEPVTAINDLIVRLAHQAAFQGLMPNDLDSVDGAAAIAAIADAIFSSKRKIAHYTTLPDEWKHAASAAWRILDREAAVKRR